MTIITKMLSKLRLNSMKCLDCGEDKVIHQHHLDLSHGKVSDETVPLCPSCHRLRHTTIDPNLDRLPKGMYSLPIDCDWDFTNHCLIKMA